jgi:hypothetical protein
MALVAMTSVHEQVDPDAKGEKPAQKIIAARNMGSVLEQ